MESFRFRVYADQRYLQIILQRHFPKFCASLKIYISFLITQQDKHETSSSRWVVPAVDFRTGSVSLW